MKLALFQSFASELVSPNIQMYSSNETDEAAQKLQNKSGSKKIHGLDRLLKHKRKLRKLWQETGF
jgi:hypothetical protein